MSQLLPQQSLARDLRIKFFPSVPARPAMAKVTPNPIHPEWVPTKVPVATTCHTCPWEAPKPDGSYTQAYLIAVVAHVFDYTPAVLTGEGRKADVVRARHAAMWLLRRFGPVHLRSYPEVGRRLGGRDHTTIIHGYRRAEAARLTFPEPETDTPLAWALAFSLLLTWPRGTGRNPAAIDHARRRRVQVTSLYYGMGYTADQIAARLALSEKQVLAILWSPAAREMFRQGLDTVAIADKMGITEAEAEKILAAENDGEARRTGVA